MTEFKNHDFFDKDVGCTDVNGDVPLQEEVEEGTEESAVVLKEGTEEKKPNCERRRGRKRRSQIVKGGVEGKEEAK